MEVNRILEELRNESEQLGEVILSLERLAAGGKKRRGRPPSWMALARASGSPEKKRRGRLPRSKNKIADTAEST